MRPKGIYVPEKYKQKYVCLWKDEEGKTVVDEEFNYLCAESWYPGNKEVETKMRIVAKGLGIEGGSPYWLPGRKVSQWEYEEQVNRLKEGLIPDEHQERKLYEAGELDGI